MSGLLLFLTLSITAPLLAVTLGAYKVRSHQASKVGKGYKFYALTFPSEFELDQVIDWLGSVSSAFPPRPFAKDDKAIVLELWSDKTGLTHRLGIPWQHTELISQLRTHINGVHVEEHRREFIPKWTHAVEVGVSDSTRPFNIERVKAQVKRVLAASVAEIKADDVLVTQWVITPAKRIKPPTTDRHTSSSSWAMRSLLGGSEAGREEIAERREKLLQNQFRGVLRVAAYSSTKPHAQKLVKNIHDAYSATNRAEVYFTKRLARQSGIMERLNRAAGLAVYPGQISASELAAFIAWPIGGPMIAGLTMGRTRYLPPNETIEKDGRVLGTASASGHETRRIAVNGLDACRHTYVIGPSGLGKTVLLGNSLQQDIEHGFGAIVLESKGDLFRRALDSVPRERLDDVVVLDLTDHDYPVGFNILQEGDPRVIVDDLTRLFVNGAKEALYLPEMMYHGLHTLRSQPGLTVIDLLPFLQPRTPQEQAWREFVISQLPRGGEMHSFWKAFDSLKSSEQQSKIRPVSNRMWQLTNRRDVRNMLGQAKSTINMREIMEQNKLLFIYVPESIGDETVSLLGSLLVSNIWDAVRAVQKDKPTFLYMDEVQRFLNLPIDLSDMLSLARSYGLGMTMAHQYTAQLPPNLFAAVTNASTKVAFRLDGPDASKMQNIFGKSVTPEDFINLTPYEVIARVATPGGSSAPTTINTLKPLQGHGLTEEVIRRSRAKYARQASDVDAEILARRTAPRKAVKARPAFGDRELSDDDN